ncbi:uncharacterized protein LOC111040012 [Myzus persicae]|uniref:uncharacterized protein LOC111040012 n=1 Tax=Myzus persicae TaxID=13164 RepID=UPI000B939C89|nr:uncharacterized protein LOC111040012 [Myzus persicae]
MRAIVHVLDDNSVESDPVHWIKNDQCAWPKNSHNIHKLRINCVKTNQFEYHFIYNTYINPICKQWTETVNLCSVPIFYTVLNLTFNYIYDLCTETLIEAEEKVLIAQYTSDISDYGSSKKRKCNDGAVETISLIPETLPSFMSIKKSKISPGYNANT